MVSDSHDHQEPLAVAVAEAKALGAMAVLHCGDLVAPCTLHAINGLGLPIPLIHGNDAGDAFHLSRFEQEPGNRVRYCGQDTSPGLAQRRIFMVHYKRYAEAMALTVDYERVGDGREHRAGIEHIWNNKGRRDAANRSGDGRGREQPQDLRVRRPRDPGIRNSDRFALKDGR